MPVYDLYSRRKKRAEQVEPDVYQYDELPTVLRTQIRLILDDALGPYVVNKIYSSTPENNACWKFVCEVIGREKGLLRLGPGDHPKEECISYLNTATDIDDCLSLIEVAFSLVDTFVRNKGEDGRKRLGVSQEPDDAIDELNFRFREAGVGYQFEGGQIIRVDSQLIHSEVVQPALQLLSDPRFKGAQEEFLAAHAHYRAGEYKDAATDALNSFESTLKTICDVKEWTYPKGARATDLLKIVRKEALLPDYLDASFDQLVATLSSGLPKVRNEEGGHGQGAKPKETPSHVAAYALHLAAAKVVLLVEAFKASTMK